jgi:SAM-dependent methyltransferase
MSTTPAENETGTSTDDQVREYYHRILPFYETELKDRGDADLWAWAASEPAGCRVLEIGAGTGRATRFLARTAGRVVAFDLSLETIAVARRRFAEQPHVSFLVADLRILQLAERFDLIAAVDDPFVHLTADEDRERAFARVAEHLAPDGRFLLDAAWLSPERRHTAEEGGLVEDREEEGGLSVREVWRCDAGSRLCTTGFEYRVDGRLEAKASFPSRLWSLVEIEARCRAAGLEITRLWGDYDRRPWDRATSSRLIAEMRRERQVGAPVMASC